MTERPQTAEQLRSTYLAELDTAIGSLPYAIATELRAGIGEELDGLDHDATRQRIAELGDPAAIAEAAREAAESDQDPSPTPPAAATAPPPAAGDPASEAQSTPSRRYLVDTPGFAFTGLAVLGGGGLLLPFFGWIVGVSLVTSSRFWYRWEKTIAVLLPVVATGVVFAVNWWLAPSTSAANPLLPGPHILVLGTMALSSLVSAGWLFVRLRGRSEPVTRSRLERADPSLGTPN